MGRHRQGEMGITVIEVIACLFTVRKQCAELGRVVEGEKYTAGMLFARSF